MLLPVVRSTAHHANHNQSFVLPVARLGGSALPDAEVATVPANTSDNTDAPWSCTDTANIT